MATENELNDAKIRTHRALAELLEALTALAQAVKTVVVEEQQRGRK